MSGILPKITLLTGIRGQRCNKCHKKVKKGEITLETCPNCSYAYYCSEECQSEDLESHVYSGECDILQG